MTKINLFCLPYAGGSSTMFYKLRPYLSEHIVLRPIELAGRGSRFDEPFSTTIEDMANDVLSRIEPDLITPYAILGYSMGGLIAFELNRIVLSVANMKNINLPRHTIYAAIPPPHALYKFITAPIHQYDDETFIDAVIALGGVNRQELTERTILMEFVNILRNDFQAVWTYEMLEHDILRHNSAISILYSDSEDTEGITEWSQYTEHQCCFHYFEGGHFFIHNNHRKLARIINEILADRL